MARNMVKRNRHIGSRLDDLLAEDKVLEEVTARALKRVIAWQLQQAMKNQESHESGHAQINPRHVKPPQQAEES